MTLWTVIIGLFFNLPPPPSPLLHAFVSFLRKPILTNMSRDGAGDGVVVVAHDIVVGVAN